MKRRDFLQFSALSTMAGSAFMPAFSFAANPDMGRRILVLVELEGGNDGLNTLIPYTDPLYRSEKVRPNLALPASRVLDVGNHMGMHPSLKPLMPLWREDDMAWIQNVGYPRHDRSHFRSRDVWEKAGSPRGSAVEDGWLAKVLPQKSEGIHGVVVGDGLGPMTGKRCRSVAMRDPVTFLQQASSLQSIQHPPNNNPSLQHIVDVQQQLHGAKDALKRSARMRHVDRYFRTARTFNNDLRSIAKMIVGGADASVYKVTLGGFDTHASQAVPHQNLLAYLADGLLSFSNAMKGSDLWDQVLVMTYSEFGRRIKENLSGGTDHGAAAPVLVMGGKVKGGVLYGRNPDLKNHLSWNLRHQYDIRSLYGTVARSWWGYENPWANYQLIDFV